MQFNFIKLRIRCILNLAAKVAKFCRFHQDAVLILTAAETFINFRAVSMQIIFSHIRFKVASYSACYLTNGVYIPGFQSLRICKDLQDFCRSLQKFAGLQKFYRSLQIFADLQNFYRSLQICADWKKRPTQEPKKPHSNVK